MSNKESDLAILHSIFPEFSVDDLDNIYEDFHHSLTESLNHLYFLLSDDTHSPDVSKNESTTAFDSNSDNTKDSTQYYSPEHIDELVRQVLAEIEAISSKKKRRFTLDESSVRMRLEWAGYDKDICVDYILSEIPLAQGAENIVDPVASIPEVSPLNTPAPSVSPARSLYRSARGSTNTVNSAVHRAHHWRQPRRIDSRYLDSFAHVRLNQADLSAEEIPLVSSVSSFSSSQSTSSPSSRQALLGLPSVKEASTDKHIPHLHKARSQDSIRSAGEELSHGRKYSVPRDKSSNACLDDWKLNPLNQPQQQESTGDVITLHDKQHSSIFGGRHQPDDVEMRSSKCCVMMTEPDRFRREGGLSADVSMYLPDQSPLPELSPPPLSVSPTGHQSSAVLGSNKASSFSLTEMAAIAMGAFVKSDEEKIKEKIEMLMALHGNSEFATPENFRILLESTNFDVQQALDILDDFERGIIRTDESSLNQSKKAVQERALRGLKNASVKIEERSEKNNKGLEKRVLKEKQKFMELLSALSLDKEKKNQLNEGESTPKNGINDSGKIKDYDLKLADDSMKQKNFKIDLAKNSSMISTRGDLNVTRGRSSRSFASTTAPCILSFANVTTCIATLSSIFDSCSATIGDVIRATLLQFHTRKEQVAGAIERPDDIDFRVFMTVYEDLCSIFPESRIPMEDLSFDAMEIVEAAEELLACKNSTGFFKVDENGDGDDISVRCGVCVACKCHAAALLESQELEDQACHSPHYYPEQLFREKSGEEGRLADVEMSVDAQDPHAAALSIEAETMLRDFVNAKNAPSWSASRPPLLTAASGASTKSHVRADDVYESYMKSFGHAIDSIRGNETMSTEQIAQLSKLRRDALNAKDDSFKKVFCLNNPNAPEVSELQTKTIVVPKYKPNNNKQNAADNGKKTDWRKVGPQQKVETVKYDRFIPGIPETAALHPANQAGTLPTASPSLWTNLKSIDLHGLYQEEAEHVLSIRIQKIQQLLRSHADPGVRHFDLTVVTGLGKNSRNLKPVLPSTVIELTRRMGLTFTQGHPGSLIVKVTTI
eukprot:GDKJ01058301.1.p1 GENE.GDKJ01058301.1~~GDKJ01058301.1.p1  ORF type:complete len:1057 (+),score=269.17 GDKJ01058301.1:38-3208(+)